MSARDCTKTISDGRRATGMASAERERKLAKFAKTAQNAKNVDFFVAQGFERRTVLETLYRIRSNHVTARMLIGISSEPANAT